MSKLSEHLLALLEENKGNFVSGEQIAAKLSVSRSAVWKAVNQLRADGYAISAVRNKGYQLSAQCDEISQASVSRFLSGRGREIRLEILEEISSTNAYLKELAAKGQEGPLAAIAAGQTAGRGRLGRSFYSPRDTGLYLSLLVHPKLPAGEVSLLTTMAANAVCETIEEISDIKPGIKWVNDILVDGKKVCGILTEAAFGAETGLAEYVVIGIGINVFTPQNGFAAEIADTAGSLFGTERFDIRSRLAGLLLNRLMDGLEQNPRTHIGAYRRRCIVIGKDVTVISPSGSYDAYAMDIDHRCGLVVKLPNGVRKTLHSGEISIKSVSDHKI